ncbi:MULTISPECIES: DUF1800 family protein [unclassified Lentimonas]|nr:MULTISPECIES: DUF1800 family protein [unclassified Lentimonas]
MNETYTKKISPPSIKSGGAINFLRRLVGMISVGLLSIPLTSSHADSVKTTASDVTTHQTRAKASRFLAQASMGATGPEINTLAKRIKNIGHYEACEEWIDKQFAIEAETNLHELGLYLYDADTNTFGKVLNNFYHPWWHCAINDSDQLRFRTAFALSQIFVVSQNYWAGDWGTYKWSIASRYFDKLRDNAFTTHRNLLEIVTYDPLMGGYLTHLYNEKADEAAGTLADENYAREVMQLFSCGVYALETNGEVILDNEGAPVENYTNDDVQELAQVFTGFALTLDPNRSFTWEYSMTKLLTAAWYYNPMIMYEDHHDQSEKILPDGTVIPAENTGEVDVSLALDWLASHPSTAPHFSRLLIKRFTSSNPSSGYIQRVANHWNGTGPYCTSNEKGDMKAVIKAILLDSEAREAVVDRSRTLNNGNKLVYTNASDPYVGKVKEPILKMTQFYNFLELTSTNPDGYIRLGNNSRAVAQEILFANSVFNFYSSEYAPSSGPIGMARETIGYDLTAPEIEILSDSIVDEFERVNEIALNKETSAVSGESGVLEKIYSMKQNQTVSEIVGYLDLMLCGGQTPYAMILDMTEQIENSGGTKDEQIADAIALIVASPFYSVSR